MENKNFDLVVIGSGPAGEKGAAQAAYFGKAVALVEKENVLGGAAANTGTLPSKTLRESSLYLSGFKQRGLYGISTKLKEQVTAKDFLYRERMVVQGERSRISDNLEHHKVDVYRGEASFTDGHTIEVATKNGSSIHLTGEKILVELARTPINPPIFHFMTQEYLIPILF